MNATEPYAREKIGSHLSYPLKFGEVVSLLSPAVEQLNIQVWFRAWKAPRQNEELDRYEIVEAGYWYRFPDAPWHLLVRPVPRALRAGVRSVLIPAATDRLRDWFLGRPFRSRRFGVYFCPSRETIEYDEHDPA
jgi:hypothetical protein